MSPVHSSSKMTNAAVAFVAVSIVLGMIFSADIYGNRRRGCHARVSSLRVF